MRFKRTNISIFLIFLGYLCGILSLPVILHYKIGIKRIITIIPVFKDRFGYAKRDRTDKINYFEWYDPKNYHKINSPKKLNSTREKLINLLIHKSDYQVNNEALEKNDFKQFKNLRKIDQLKIQHTDGINSIAYIFYPVKSNNKLIIYHEGHDHYFTEKKKLEYLNSKGYTLMAFYMPLMGSNRTKVVKDGEEIKRHSDLLIFNNRNRSFLSLFVSPVVIALDEILKKDYFESISMIGASGGGWTTVLTSAVDTRINFSFPIAGSLPLQLTTSDTGDIEMRFNPFYKKFPYLDLYLLGSTGDLRRQIQISYSRDPYLFSGYRTSLYRKYLEDLSKEMNGHFDSLIIDEEYHGISQSVAELIHNKISIWSN